MNWTYGNRDQFTVATPECGAYVDQPSWHYFWLYYLPIMAVFAAAVNAWIVYLLCSKGGKLLKQSQHIYVLNSAIANVSFALGCTIPGWVDTALLPCQYLGVATCFFTNFFNVGIGYQLQLVVCLVCFDRYRMVKLGSAYQHSREVERAKWLVSITTCLSCVLYVVPELTVPLLVGRWHKPNIVRCRPFQAQPVPQFGNVDVNHFMNIVTTWGTWLFIAIFTCLTIWELRKARQRVSPGNSSQLSNQRQFYRASLIMFGMVLSLAVTMMPLTLVTLVSEIDPDALEFYVTQNTLNVMYSSPAVDPFVFASTLPHVRTRARQTWFGRFLGRLYNLPIYLFCPNSLGLAALSKKEASSTLTETGGYDRAAVRVKPITGSLLNKSGRNTTMRAIVVQPTTTLRRRSRSNGKTNGAFRMDSVSRTNGAMGANKNMAESVL